MILHHLAKRFGHVPARVCVVANIGDTVGREIALAHRHDVVADLFVDPRVDTMDDDEIEYSKIRAELVDAAMMQFDVGKPQNAGRFLRDVDLV